MQHYFTSITTLLVMVSWLFAQLGGPQSTAATGWEVTPVDISGQVDRGASLALDGNGSPHIAFYDPVDHVLKYARLADEGWLTEVVTPDDGSADFSLALDASGTPSIAYSNDSGGLLKLAQRGGEGWLIQEVDPLGGCSVSLKINAGGYYLAYQAKKEPEAYSVLMHAFSADGTEWTIEPAATIGPAPLIDTDIAVSPDGGVVIGYRDGMRVMVVEKRADEWQELLMVQKPGKSVAVEIGLQKEVHVAFDDESGYGCYHHRVWNGTEWTADSAICVRTGPVVMAQNSEGQISIAFSDIPFNNLTVIPSVLEVNSKILPGVKGVNPDLAAATGGRLALTYNDPTSGYLYYAERDVGSGESTPEPTAEPTPEPSQTPQACSQSSHCLFLPLVKN